MQELAPGSLPVLATEPAAHAVQEAEPLLLVNCPVAHAAQEAEPLLLVNCPVAHAAQEAEPDELIMVKNPTAQSKHELCTPLPGWYFPSGHGRHALEPFPG